MCSSSRTLITDRADYWKLIWCQESFLWIFNIFINWKDYLWKSSMFALLFLERVESTRETKRVDMCWRPNVRKEGFSDQPSCIRIEYPFKKRTRENAIQARSLLGLSYFLCQVSWYNTVHMVQLHQRLKVWGSCQSRLLQSNNSHFSAVFKDSKWCYSKGHGKSTVPWTLLWLPFCLESRDTSWIVDHWN